MQKIPIKLAIDPATGTSTEVAEKIEPSEISGQVGDLAYVHEQIAASDTWLVVHNLGKHPSVMLEDSAGEPFIAPIVRIDNNSFNVFIKSATGGKAYCN